MKIVHPDVIVPLVQEHSLINETVIEDPCFFSDLLLDLCDQLSGGNGRIVFSKNNIPCSAKSIRLVESLHRLPINTTSVLKKAFSNVEKEIMQTADLDSLYKALRDLYNVLSELGIGNLKPSIIEDTSISEILRVFGMHFPIEELSIAEHLVEYLNIYSDLFGDDLFIILHLRSYLCPDEISLLFQHVEYSKTKVWLIESNESPAPIDRSSYHRVIIDKDFSII